MKINTLSFLWGKNDKNRSFILFWFTSTLQRMSILHCWLFFNLKNVCTFWVFMGFHRGELYGFKIITQYFRINCSNNIQDDDKILLNCRSSITTDRLFIMLWFCFRWWNNLVALPPLVVTVFFANLAASCGLLDVWLLSQNHSRVFRNCVQCSVGWQK